MLATVHAAGVNWPAAGVIFAGISVVVAGVGKLIARKVDAVGRHLERQDEAREELVERVSRIEGHLNLTPKPIPLRRTR